MIDAYGGDSAPIQLAVRRRDDADGLAVLGLEQMIADTATPTGRCLGGVLSGLECLLETITHPPRQAGEVWVPKWICQ